jgi:hypothetical protein
MHGEKIDINLPPILFYVKELKKTPDLLPCVYEVFSSSLQNIINEFSKDAIQYIPAIVKENKSGIESNEYAVANILIYSDGLDHDKSELEYSNNNFVAFVDSLVLNESKIGDHAIFRLKDFPQAILVRDNLANEIIKNNLTGINFIKPEEYVS